MSLIPHRFLFRVAHPCRYAEDLLDLDETHRIENFAGVDGCRNFADVRLGWSEAGLGLVVEVRGKQRAVQGNASRPRLSDGVTLWIDTREARTAHRASRTCHQLHFLAAGGGDDLDEPIGVQTKINRALEDAPQTAAEKCKLRLRSRAGGYRLEVFIAADALQGFDPEQHPRLGFFYAVRDEELGEQLLNVTPEFPFWEDPSLWSVLELVR